MQGLLLFAKFNPVKVKITRQVKIKIVLFNRSSCTTASIVVRIMMNTRLDQIGKQQRNLFIRK